LQLSERCNKIKFKKKQKTDGQFSVSLFWRKVTGKIFLYMQSFILLYFIANGRIRFIIIIIIIILFYYAMYAATQNIPNTNIRPQIQPLKHN